MDAAAGLGVAPCVTSVKQDVTDDGSSGDYGEVEVDGGAQQAELRGIKVKSEEAEPVDRNKEPLVSQDGTGEGDAKEKTLLTYRRRAPAAAQPQTLITPKLEESPRPVRANRGMKRRYPGDESDDADARRPARVRSMTEVFAESARYSTPSEQSAKVVGERGAKQRLRAKRRGRPSRANGSKKVFRGVYGEDYSDQPRQGNMYVCNHEGCDKAFSEPGALYRHARVHGDRPYVCHYEGCNRRFLERSKLKRHYLIHTGEKSFVCLYEGCGKAFSLDFNLRSHMKTHTGEYHECPHEGCEKKYCQNYKLRAHMCKDHNMLDGNDMLLDALKETPEMKAAKKQEKLQLLIQRKEKLDKWRDGRKKRIQELEVELERETRELGKIDKALKKLDREKDQLELDESEFSSSDDLIEPDIEQAEEKDVLVFAQKLTADQGARLVQADPRMQSSDVLVSRPSSEFAQSSSALFWNPRISENSSNSNLEKPGSWYQGQQTQTGDSSVWSMQGANHKLLLLQQSELPVTHLFSFQEQPCLVD